MTSWNHRADWLVKKPENTKTKGRDVIMRDARARLSRSVPKRLGRLVISILASTSANLKTASVAQGILIERRERYPE